MKTSLVAGSIITASLLAGSTTYATESTPKSKLNIPAHYKLGSGGCRAGGGYSFIASAPGHPSTYPKLILKVFNGEVIGMIFEAGVEAGWKPWYGQPKGKPISHGGGPAHYSQTIYLKKPPTATECASSKGPLGDEK